MRSASYQPEESAEKNCNPRSAGEVLMGRVAQALKNIKPYLCEAFLQKHPTPYNVLFENFLFPKEILFILILNQIIDDCIFLTINKINFVPFFFNQLTMILILNFFF